MKRNNKDKKRRVMATRELSYIIIVISTVTLGIVSQILSSSGHIIFNIANYESISLSAIQIQGAIFGVTVALLALMSGRITESYLGIRYNDFLLNLKPKVFKQKTLIALSLILIVLNILVHMTGWFSMVISIFIAACELIWISVDEIYEAFSGRERLEDEIKTYLWDHIDSPNEENTINYLVDFCNEWKSIAAEQGNVEYSEYWDTFSKLFHCAFKTDRCRAQLLDQCTVLSKTMLCDSRSVERGIEFFKWCYQHAWRCLNENLEFYEKQKVAFNLLNSSYEFLTRSIENTSIQIVEDNILWSGIIEIIILVNLRLAYDAERPWKETELGSVESLSGYFGRVIVNKPDRDNSRWGKELSNFRLYVALPEDLKEIFDEVLTSCKLRFMIAQIRNDPNSLVKKYLIDNNHYPHDISQNHALMILYFHCYLWYVVFYESSSYIDQECIERCKQFLNDINTKRFIKHIILDVGLHDKNIIPQAPVQYDVFNDRLERKLLDCLRVYEAMPMNGEAKLVIMDSAIEDYFVYLTLYLSRLFNKAELVDSMIAGNKATTLYLKFIRNEDRRAKLKGFYELLNEASDEVDDKVEASYSLLEDRLRQLYKVEYISWAKKIKSKEIEFHQERKEKLSQEIKCFLESQFSGLLSDTGNACLRLPLVSVSLFADMDFESFIHDRFEVLFHSFTRHIAKYLLMAGRLNRVKKSEFHDDEHYFDYLSSKSECVVVGSEFRLSPFDYRNKEKVKSFIEKTEHYTNGANGCTLLLKRDSLHFSIKKIRVGSRSQKLEEVNYEFDKNTGLYCYNVSVGMPVMFEKRELEEYLNNTHRVFNIVVHIELTVNEGVVGDLIEN